jgi:hypothetical protein
MLISVHIYILTFLPFFGRGAETAFKDHGVTITKLCRLQQYIRRYRIGLGWPWETSEALSGVASMA